MTQVVDGVYTSWPTLYGIGKQILDVDVTAPRNDRAGRPNSEFRSVVDGMTPEAFPTREGTFYATPEQLLSLKVPLLEQIDGDLVGFQRTHNNLHVRKIARGILDGKEITPITVSIFPDGNPYVTDGQHRSLGAIVSRTPVRVDVRHRTVEQANELFTNQRLSRKLSQDQVILTGTSPLELYIQDAVTSDDHPWSNLVGTGKVGDGVAYKMSPTTAALVIGFFSYNVLSSTVSRLVDREDSFDKLRADKMARLLSAFGTKQTNELAWRANPLRSIAATAVHVFLRNPNATADDERRWIRHMGTFDFGKYPHLLNKGDSELTQHLVAHWNKRLTQERKINLSI